ncbi:MAG: outer membrane lipoprotein carrier protein LolA [Treponema sp.]|nr:outer membrane lipoprotein carrier protein LolA [Spirochaetia bacterium]MDD7459590.1 outer membrane lipoprotein carrier protein LolA [Spirochaetales bacterium]MDY5812747.1 outer membrane lipoprotein carrier protein LolA [Treponema sp.]MEE1180843.1 outer membrane lipoprotein carrier protein LolA [Treponema sp.]
MKKLMTVALCLVFLSIMAFAQGITTASDYFKTISSRYSEIQDYEADVIIKIGKSDMTGRISYKRPEMLRIDFSDPAEQVVLFNGSDLTIYLPGSSAILEQNVSANDAKGANAATAEGLSLLRRYYTIAYESGQSAVPLEEGSDEMVVNFLLQRRSATESFREIKLSVDPSTKLIRRVHAVTAQDENYIFDIFNYKLNSNISDQRFIYDPPSSANNYNNFLLSE